MKPVGLAMLSAWMLLSIAWQESAFGQNQTVAPDAGVSFQERACTFQEYLGAELQCGILVVPEDYDNPNGLLLHLPVIRIGPFDPDKMAVVLGGGGPGEQAVRDDFIYWWNDFREYVFEERGIIIAEQRGVGEKYNLRCTRMANVWEGIFSRELSQHEEWDEVNVLARECMSEFSAQGIDLQNYTTETSARDFENLRRIMGIKKLDLIGESYAGMVAFEMIYSYPDSVNLALMDSPLIPQHSYSLYDVEVDLLFDRLANECNESQECRGRFGDMRSNLKMVLDRLEESPLLVPYSNWTALPNDGNRPLVLTRDRFAWAVMYSFYSEELVATLPAFLSQMSQTVESDLLLTYLENLLGSFLDDSFADGLYDSITCREQDPFTRYEDPRQSGIVWSTMSAAELELVLSNYCNEVWFAGPPLPPNPPKSIKVPVLIISGDIDPITPGRLAAELADRYSSVQHVTVPGVHGQFVNPCGQYTAWLFIEDPWSDVGIHEDCVRNSWWD